MMIKGKTVLCWAVFMLSSAGLSVVGSDRPPYPPSPVIKRIVFHNDTWVKAAPGSDQFGYTWAADDNIYVAWGGGGGFGGTNSLGRSSLGIARIEGMPPNWRAVNVWGGLNPLSKQRPILGKVSSGIIAIDDAIYIYVVEQDVWTNNHLWVSRDLGMSWRDLGQVFNEPGAAFASPGIIQFGRAYRGARDNYIYGYSDKPWRDGLALFRVPKDKLADRNACEFFAGLDERGNPKWTKYITKQKPVFVDPNGTEWGVTCVYHPVLKRYLLCVRHNGDSGEWGIFDAPEPWGPWTTAAYGKDLPEWTYTPDPKGASPNRPAWMHMFPAKWMSEDGRTMWHICDRGDQFNLMKATLILRRSASSP